MGASIWGPGDSTPVDATSVIYYANLAADYAGAAALSASSASTSAASASLEASNAASSAVTAGNAVASCAAYNSLGFNSSYTAYDFGSITIAAPYFPIDFGGI